MIVGRLPVGFPTRLRARGVTVVERPGWRDNVSSSSAWAANAWAIHHDAGSQSQNVRSWVENHADGRRNHNGTVTYQGGIWGDGVLYLWGGGRSANAGQIDSARYDETQQGRRMPDRPSTLQGKAINSTPLLGGFMMNGGVGAADNFTPAQIDTATRLGVCLVLDYGYPTVTLGEHRQYAGYRGKPDPSWGARNWARLVETELAQLPPGDDVTPEQDKLLRRAAAAYDTRNQFIETADPETGAPIATTRLAQRIRNAESRSQTAATNAAAAKKSADQALAVGNANAQKLAQVLALLEAGTDGSPAVYTFTGTATPKGA